jgi:hypothetical protein
MATRTPKAVHYELLRLVASTVAAMELRDIPPENVYLRKVPTNQGVGYPCCLVTPWGSETLAPGDFEDHEVGYPVLLTFLDTAAALTFDLDDDRELMWRQQAIDRFIDLPLEESDEADTYDCRVEPFNVVDLNAFLGQGDEGPLYVSPLLLRFMTTRRRGRE